MSTQLPLGMEHHPDIVELREQYERASATPRAQVLEACALVAGLFLAVSPWVVAFTNFRGLTISNLVLGLAFAVLMAGYGSAYERTHARAWTATVIGLWTIIAPWAVNGGAHVRRTILTNVITGGIMTCLGAAAIAMTVSLAISALRRGAKAGGG